MKANRFLLVMLSLVCVTLAQADQVDDLLPKLHAKEPADRIKAVEMLGKVGGARAVEPLIASLKDEDFDVRAKSAEALGLLGDRRAILHLKGMPLPGRLESVHS